MTCGALDGEKTVVSDVSLDLPVGSYQRNISRLQVPLDSVCFIYGINSGLSTAVHVVYGTFTGV